MHWVVGTWLISSLLGLGTGHNTLFEGYGTLSGYHLCNVTELVSVTNVISFPTSLTQRRPCGGWLPWKMCDVTVYKTEYHTQVYNMSKQVMKCCHGYEQVGSYCAVSLNRSAEFTSKPGLCPSASVTGSLRNHSTSGSMCKWDIDCPQWQKCCQKENISNIYQCSNPVPANRTCFNVTITVKTSFQLVTMDKGLFNHTRLLYSMVTGALETIDTSVHHVRSWSAGPFTTSSSLLVCSNVFFLGDISTRLNHLGNIEEVTDVGVQDVDPCSVPELNSCSPDADCMNTAGYSSCVCHHGYEDLNPSQPGTVCIRKALSTTLPFTNTTTTPPRTTLPPTGNTTYTDGEQMSTNPSNPSIADPSSHSNNPPHSQPASTCDGQTLLVTARFTNMNYTVALSDQTSDDYKTFCKAVLDEILLSSPPDLQALLISKQVTIQITSLSAGSVIVNFSITFQNGSNPNMSSIATDLVSLRNSSKYTVGNISIHMQDFIPEITSLFSYDVNASAFSVAWTTNNQTVVIFHLVLLNGTIELKNMSHVANFNWTFTDLNPAVLYTVRVTPFACGNWGNSNEIKVRTDGQTLLVTARFTNMNYTVALSDQTSDAYKTFCKAVLDEILLSSPPDLQALLISKQVTIQITSLSAGSVIVNFSITFQNGSNPNMSSIATDLVSLRNSSKYTVGNISIHMQDSPNATTTINPTTNYPGVSSTASSTAKSSITATQFGNPSMSSTHTARPQTNTNTTGPSTATTNTLTTNTQHSTTILAPITPNPFGHQDSNITGSLVSYITVECRISNTSVFIRKEGLQAYGVPENALYLGEPQCVVNGRNESHVWLTAAWDKCNTTREQNSNHTSFNVILFNNFSVAPNVHLKVPIICTYPSDISISMGYGALTGYDMINGLVAGFGRFQATLRLMNGMSPLPENYAFSKDEEVVVEVGLNPTVPQINPVINKCWVTSGQDSTVSLGPEFLVDGCAVANLPTTVLQNGNDSVSLLSVRIFSLMDKDVIFLHCQVRICFETQDKTCTPDCLRSASRSYSSAEATASIGPLNRLLEASPQNDTSNALPTVGFVLLGVGVFLLSLAAIAGLVCHKRKIGNYNFNLNPQQENFSYHVFST